MLRRLIILTACAAIGLSAVFALPKQIRLLSSAVSLEWPNQSGPWVKIRDGEPSPQELNILAKDTSFANAQYTRANSNIPLNAGIVLSGDDINNSIHRPERCLVAQGHTSLQPVKLNIPLANGKSLPVTRLRSQISREEATADGKGRAVHAVGVTYYWFIGHDTITNSHYERTFKDMQDRLFRGSNQRWAYITISVYLPENEQTRRLLPPDKLDGPIDTYIQEFIAQVIPGMIHYKMIK